MTNKIINYASAFYMSKLCGILNTVFHRLYNCFGQFHRGATPSATGHHYCLWHKTFQLEPRQSVIVSESIDWPLYL